MEISTIKATIIKTNNYLVSQDKTCVLIECSLTEEQLKAALGDRKLSAILLTHGHWDHFLTAEKIGNNFKVPIYCTKECAQKIIDSQYTTLKVARKVNIDTNNLEFHFIENNEVLEFGKLSFKVLFTQGHSDCGVCYQADDVLFTGDTLFRNAFGRTDLPTGDADALLNSLKKLGEMPEGTCVMPGHGTSTTIRAEKKMIDSLALKEKHSEETADFTPTKKRPDFPTTMRLGCGIRWQEIKA